MNRTSVRADLYTIKRLAHLGSMQNLVLVLIIHEPGSKQCIVPIKDHFRISSFICIKHFLIYLSYIYEGSSLGKHALIYRQQLMPSCGQETLLLFLPIA